MDSMPEPVTETPNEAKQDAMIAANPAASFLPNPVFEVYTG